MHICRTHHLHRRQRISSILHADTILVLDEGKLVDKGTHKELMQRCPVYQQIAYSQLSMQEISDHE
jgi:ATP-binding cassette subfamily B protein